MPYHLATPHCDNNCHHITSAWGYVKEKIDLFEIASGTEFMLDREIASIKNYL
jgi:hypothetical protein